MLLVDSHIDWEETVSETLSLSRLYYTEYLLRQPMLFCFSLDVPHVFSDCGREKVNGWPIWTYKEVKVTRGQKGKRFCNGWICMVT